MKCTWVNGAIATLILALVAGTGAWAQEQATPKPGNAGAAASAANQAADPPEKDTAELAAVAMSRAAKANKYLFMLVYRTEDEPTQTARKTLNTALEKLTDRAITSAVNVTDPLEREFVAKYGLDRAPTPLVLAIAPNGAVTRSFAGQFVEAQFETAIVSPGAQKCIKALQDRKLIFICVQNDKTQHNAEVMQGVKEFAADAQYTKTTEIITLDPADAAEGTFLNQLKVDPKTEEAITVFMAPPGTIVATYKGETKKDVLVAAAKKAATACDPKSGCCPAPKKTATPPAQPQTQQPGAAEKKS